MAESDETLTVEEAAAILKVDPATVQRELKARRLPGNKVGNKIWRIRRDDLRVYLKGQQRDPRAAMEYATYCFRSGDFKTGLATLVGSLGYEEMPPQLGFAMFRRVAVLIEAVEAVDSAKAVKIAERTRWNPESDDAFAITYYPTTPGFSPPWTVRLPAVWNTMLHEFVFALRTHHRHQASTRSKLILQWQDNWGNSVTPPQDAEKCREAIEEVVSAGTLVVMVRLNNKWTVVKADAQQMYVGSGPYGPAYEDVTNDVTKALAEACRPREDYR